MKRGREEESDEEIARLKKRIKLLKDEKKRARKEKKKDMENSLKKKTTDDDDSDKLTLPLASQEKQSEHDGPFDKDADKWEIGNDRIIKLSEFRRVTRVDIREYYDADGELKPGRKGICLDKAQWDTLKTAIDVINEHLTNNKEFTGTSLSNDNKKQITVRRFRKILRVDIREYYNSDGEWKPGRKGICLSQDQWKLLVAAVPYIDAKLPSS
eukprot:TRINITY_DN16684_c0_g1_i1.p1 TRINITY_DN16684_c0_g1~~TRINITY_DN16684_c0_g1_i1.p1  ORF type:complete len:225 (-),score=50.05 TRINITY_DN16684_c0_g1_i1:118-753(-)